MIGNRFPFAAIPALAGAVALPLATSAAGAERQSLFVAADRISPSGSARNR